MTRYIKNLIADLNNFHKKNLLYLAAIWTIFLFTNLQNQLIQSIHTAKQKYFNKISKTLCDPLTSTKCSWLLLKTILNGKKVLCIAPIFHSKKYVTDFKRKE